MNKFWAIIILAISVKASLGCKKSNEAFVHKNNTKFNGISLTATKQQLKQKNILHITNVNANAVALMPFGFLQNLNTPNIRYNEKWQWFGETSKGIKQYITMLQKHHIKIMLKPQLWIKNGEFTGFITMKTEKDWLSLENNYRSFIIEFAKIAQEFNIEVFCIGTELEKFVINRPDFWKNLTLEIKEIYKGKLTYAANWDEYKKINIWSHLDYIGIDAYFPLSDAKTPTLNNLKKNWKPHKTNISKLSSTYKKPIIFTEFGYRSINFCTKTPWNSSKYNDSINLKAQSVALKAIYSEFWNEDWFSGGFLWKWYPNHTTVGGIKNNRFTPQNKPAEKLLKQLYAN